MPCTIYRRKREITVPPHFTCNTTIHTPIHKWRAHIARLARPPHLPRPAFVAHPVPDHVVRARVDEHTHAALEELRDVVRVLVQPVSGRPERSVYFRRDPEKFPPDAESTPSAFWIQF